MRILEQTGAIDIEPADGGVVIVQQSVCGERPDSVFIPAPMVALVCKAIQAAAQSQASGGNDGR